VSGYIALQRDEVSRWLEYQDCTASVREAMKAFSADGTRQPLRQIHEVGQGNFFALMPGVFGAPLGFGAKLVSVWRCPDSGRSFHNGVVVSFEPETGAIRMVADAHEITKIRTACASAVATECLSRKDSRVLTVIGAGTQADAHIRALSLVRDFSDILVVGRNAERAARFVDDIGMETGLPVRLAQNARQAASNADVICTVTTSDQPVLFGDWVRPGTHVNLVGSSHDGPVEADSQLVKKGLFVVDSRHSALAAAAELRRAVSAGVVDEDHIHAEIGEVLLARAPGRTRADQVTIYKSLGHICQDLAALACLEQRLARNGLAS